MSTLVSRISLPKLFTSRDATEWFQRYEICCRANTWDEEKKALKLPTLMEGEALTIWLKLTKELEVGDNKIFTRRLIVMNISQ